MREPKTNKRRSKLRDESEWIRTQRPELAIVSGELWDRVQARLNFFGQKPSEGRRRGLFARALTSPYLFSGMLKCGECGANLIIGTGGGTHIHKKYLCANYFNRGTCGNDLYIRRDILEERLLERLQRELLRPEVIDYTVAEFGRQLRAALSSMSNDLGVLRRRKEQLEGFTGHTLMLERAAIYLITLLSVFGLVILCRRDIKSGVLLISCLTVFPLVYYLVQFEYRYCYPIMWATFLLGAILLTACARQFWETLARSLGVHEAESQIKFNRPATLPPLMR